MVTGSHTEASFEHPVHDFGRGQHLGSFAQVFLTIGMSEAPLQHTCHTEHVKVCWRMNIISFWWIISEPCGCSKWKWKSIPSPELQLTQGACTIHKCTFSAARLWATCWARRSDLVAFRRFQRHHGEHFGETQMCLGLNTHKASYRRQRPAYVLKSPCLRPKRIAVRPCIWLWWVSWALITAVNFQQMTFGLLPVTLNLFQAHMTMFLLPVSPHFMIDGIFHFNFFMKHGLKILDIMNLSVRFLEFLKTYIITYPWSELSHILSRAGHLLDELVGCVCRIICSCCVIWLSMFSMLLMRWPCIWTSLWDLSIRWSIWLPGHVRFGPTVLTPCLCTGRWGCSTLWPSDPDLDVVSAAPVDDLPSASVLDRPTYRFRKNRKGPVGLLGAVSILAGKPLSILRVLLDHLQVGHPYFGPRRRQLAGETTPRRNFVMNSSCFFWLVTACRRSARDGVAMRAANLWCTRFGCRTRWLNAWGFELAFG